MEGTADDVVRQVGIALTFELMTTDALANPEAVKGLIAAGMQPASSSPEEFGAFIKAEIDKWTKVTRQANITIK